VDQDRDVKIWKGRPAVEARLPFCLFIFILLGAAPFFLDDYLGLMSLILFLILFLPSWLLLTLFFVKRKQYEIDLEKITVSTGVFFKKTVTIERSQILSVQVKQDPWGRLLGYGHLLLSIRGTSGVTVVLENIKHPLTIKNLILAVS
jgi:uncharacterized membrane protein YdbT with pleckstrin-like domain